MSVRIHEAGKNHASAEVEFFAAPRGAQPLDAAARANRSDAIVMNEQRTVANDAEIREGAAAPGYSSAQSKQFRTAGDQPIRHDNYSANSNTIR